MKKLPFALVLASCLVLGAGIASAETPVSQDYTDSLVRAESPAGPAVRKFSDDTLRPYHHKKYNGHYKKAKYDRDDDTYNCDDRYDHDDYRYDRDDDRYDRDRDGYRSHRKYHRKDKHERYEHRRHHEYRHCDDD